MAPPTAAPTELLLLLGASVVMGLTCWNVVTLTALTLPVTPYLDLKPALVPLEKSMSALVTRPSTEASAAVSEVPGGKVASTLALMLPA